MSNLFERLGPLAQAALGTGRQLRGQSAFLKAGAGTVALTLVVSCLLVFTVELVVRGSLSQTLLFFQQPFRPSWTTVVLFALIIVFFDALLGRAYQALLLIAPIVILLAFVGHQKSLYLGDPLYPTDFLYARQIVELMPLLVRQRPLAALAMLAVAMGGVALLIAAWRYWRRRSKPLSWRARATRLAVAAPALVFFGSMMDYASFSWARDRLQIIPMMWDQKENYNSNGFAIAFALNVPMAKVAAPEGYAQKAIDALSSDRTVAVAAPGDKPDIIVIMSESFWDPTLLPGVDITPDPIPSVRSLKSGSVFSPEFGGMTANVEFEALTGFSNAFLPYGSIPYQQYVRAPMPSLAKFLKSEGYVTRAIHPFAGWFWNRTPVYSAFGFDRFMSEENLPALQKRGPLVSDAAFTEEIIKEAEATKDPFFFFGVSLQGHGPYEPFRYFNNRHAIETKISSWSRDSLQTYSEGVSDADRGLQRLVDWASTRKRRTIIAFFGDHLPPLGPIYTETGFMKEQVADRMAGLPDLSIEHQTPLVLWSNRGGPARGVGAISPSYLPLHLLRMAGFSHPYYTGFLGAMYNRYHVVDRNMLVSSSGMPTKDWSRQKKVDPFVRDLRLLQYDLMFGKRFGETAFFPEAAAPKPAAM